METIIRKVDKKIHYPVGYHIQHNISVIKAMSVTISNLIKDCSSNIRLVLCCRGSSGAIIAGIIACDFPKSIIYYVRKDEEQSHSSNAIEINSDDVIIIVDDFISSGETIFSIYESIMNYADNMKIFAIIIGGDVFNNEINRIKEVINPKYFVYNKRDENI